MTAPDPAAVDLALLDPLLAEAAGVRGSLIPVLQKAQEVYGYLPAAAIARISERLRVPESEIFGVLTFYSQFYLTPRGRHVVRCCRGTACHVRGAKAVLRKVEDRLGLTDGETTPDFQFTLETVACLGACALAPVMVVDGGYYGKMTPQKIDAILDRAEGK